MTWLRFSFPRSKVEVLLLRWVDDLYWAFAIRNVSSRAQVVYQYLVTELLGKYRPFDMKPEDARVFAGHEVTIAPLALYTSDHNCNLSYFLRGGRFHARFMYALSCTPRHI